MLIGSDGLFVYNNDNARSAMEKPMTYDETLPTKEILKARRRADYQRHKNAMRIQRAQRKQAKDTQRKREKEEKAAQLQELIKPATALAEHASEAERS